MRQIIQDLKSGDTLLEEVPVPRPGRGEVLIRTRRSLVSLGTEKMLVSFGQASLLQKARQQPERVKEVINKMKTDGVRPTLEAVFRKLDTPLPLGYSQAGVVVETGEGVTGFRAGDRVISNGHHAELVSVPENLVAAIPEGVSFEEASFGVVGAIALQGIRLIAPTFGETVAVQGLGLIGLIAAQLLRADGCRVIGLDPDPGKLAKADELGLTAFSPAEQDPVARVRAFTGGTGADAVLIAASAKSNEVVRQAAKMSRKRGRIVLTGVVGLDLDRSDFYEKELSFQVSCSYGPGRYDEEYEQKGRDYPLPYVRWTEKRNFEAVLRAIAGGQLDVGSLVTERVPLEEYKRIYAEMEESRSIASVLEYPKGEEKLPEAGEKGALRRSIKVSEASFEGGTGVMAVAGAGNFTRATVLPALEKAGARIKYIASSGGLSSTDLAKKHGIPHSTTDVEEALEDPEVTGLLITTRHNLHAGMTARALRAGKQVFTEKPLALNEEELSSVVEAAGETGNTVTVGFNRRFSPHARKMKALLGEEAGPMNVTATMNAGQIPDDAWVHDPEVGGGRIIGEACHLVDLITYLTGSLVTEVGMQAMGRQPNARTDNASILLKYADGSLGTVHYYSNGHKSYAKERVECYCGGRTLVLDNFRKLYGYGTAQGFTLSNRMMSTAQDKGHRRQFELLNRAWKEGGGPLIPLEELVNTTRATFAAIASLEEGRWIRIS